VGTKPVSPSGLSADLGYFKRIVVTQNTVALNPTKSAPCCTKDAKMTIGTSLWDRSLFSS